MTRIPDPATLAPHVDGTWAEAFVVELRLLDIPGTRIGDALAEVEAHCHDAGESAPDAFGDPVAYARSLDLAPDADTERDVRKVGLGAGLQLVGLFVVPGAVGPLVRGEDAGLTAGFLLGGLVALLCIVALVVRSGPLLRGFVERPWVSGLVLWVALSAAVLPVLLWRTTVLTVSPLAAVALGIVLLVVGCVLEARALGAPDVVVDPTAPVPQRARFPFAVLLMPLATIVLAGIAAVAA